MSAITVSAPPSASGIDRLIKFWERFSQPVFYAVLIIWSILCIAPLYFTLVFSFKPVDAAYAPPIYWPSPFTFSNYGEILFTFADRFPRWLFNSILVSVVVMILRVLFCAMSGYAFARFEFPGKNFLFTAMLISMMIPGQVTLIPNFLIIGPGIVRGGLDISGLNIPTGFGLVNNLMGVILPGICAAFGVFMMTQFYKSIPKELEEAAEMDGASRFGTFFRIILPVSQTQLITLALLTFQGEWNAFMWPLLVLRTPEMFTLPIGLQWFRGEYYSLIPIVLAGSLFNTLPILILFFVFQRYFVQSIATSGSKEG